MAKKEKFKVVLYTRTGENDELSAKTRKMLVAKGVKHYEFKTDQFSLDDEWPKGFPIIATAYGFMGNFRSPDEIQSIIDLI